MNLSDCFRGKRCLITGGLGFIGSPKSLPTLEEVARRDIVWLVRETARETAADIALLAKEGGSRK